MENDDDVIETQQASVAKLAVTHVSVIIPVFNAARSGYLRECLLSILEQRDVDLRAVQLVLYDDASTDGSFDMARALFPRLSVGLGHVLMLRGAKGPLGCGGARNRACEKATGSIFIFQDADDVMLPTRIARSVQALERNRPGPYIDANDDAVTDDVANKGDKRYVSDVVGGCFERIPEGSTPRYEAYHRRLQTKDLFSHAFRDAPLAMPTVACRAAVWRAVPFVEGPGVPEDLHFFYDAMRKGFRLHKLLGENLMRYRFHSQMTSLLLHRRMLLSVRVRAFEDLVLTKPNWRDGFSIWNSGRDGKDVYKMLSHSSKRLLKAWGDIAPRKIGQRLHDVEVVHFSKLKAPIACCVVLDREDRQFEANLASLNLLPGVDYVHLV